MKIERMLVVGYVLITIIIFICNIFQPLERWVVGAWIAMAGFNYVIANWK